MASSYKFAEYTAQQTDTAIWTPAAGNRVQLTGLNVQNGAAAAVDVTFKFGAATFFKAYLTASQRQRDVLFPDGIVGGAGESVTVTTSAAVAVAVTLVGVELAT